MCALIQNIKEKLYNLGTGSWCSLVSAKVAKIKCMDGWCVTLQSPPNLSWIQHRQIGLAAPVQIRIGLRTISNQRAFG